MSFQVNVNKLFSFLKAAFPQLNITPGTVASAMGSAVALLQTDAENLTSQVAQNAFIGTARGTALDNLAQDRGITRLTGSISSGTLTLSRTSSSVAQSGPSGLQFSTNNADPLANVYFITTQPYTFAVGVTSVSVSAVAQNVGSNGNVGTGLITNIVTQSNGVETLTNPTPFTGGTDTESDDALRSRVLSSMAPQNTVQRVKAAALGVAGIISAYVVDQQDFQGNFLVYASDVTGSLYSSSNSAVVAATNTAKSLGSTGSVLAPVMLLQNISYEFAIRPGWQVATVQQGINNIITQYFNSIQIGQVLRPYDIMALVLGAIPGNPLVPGVLNFRITNPPSYLSPLPWQIYKLGTISATQTTY